MFWISNLGTYKKLVQFQNLNYHSKNPQLLVLFSHVWGLLCKFTITLKFIKFFIKPRSMLLLFNLALSYIKINIAKYIFPNYSTEVQVAYFIKTISIIIFNAFENLNFYKSRTGHVKFLSLNYFLDPLNFLYFLFRFTQCTEMFKFIIFSCGNFQFLKFLYKLC